MIREIRSLFRLQRMLKVEDMPSGMCVLETEPRVWLDNILLVLKGLGASPVDLLNQLCQSQV